MPVATAILFGIRDDASGPGGFPAARLPSPFCERMSMHRQRMVYVVSCGIAAAALVGGGGLVVAYGFSPPPWLLTAELAILSAVALVGGFTACLPALVPWLRLRPVRGAMLICLGVAAVYLPPQFIASAVFLGLGVKLVWAEACDLAAVEKLPVSPGTAIRRAGDTGEIAKPGRQRLGAASPGVWKAVVLRRK
jgi:hypothetical protein